MIDFWKALWNKDENFITNIIIVVFLSIAGLYFIFLAYYNEFTKKR